MCLTRSFVWTAVLVCRRCKTLGGTAATGTFLTHEQRARGCAFDFVLDCVQCLLARHQINPTQPSSRSPSDGGAWADLNWHRFHRAIVLDVRGMMAQCGYRMRLQPEQRSYNGDCDSHQRSNADSPRRPKQPDTRYGEGDEGRADEQQHADFEEPRVVTYQPDQDWQQCRDREDGEDERQTLRELRVHDAPSGRRAQSGGCQKRS